tara:strand:+ start:1252 stop:2367 length:1116 start_codon:yes stop_codon:yes gene_type:complete
MQIKKKIIISSNSTWFTYNFRYGLVKSLLKDYEVYIFSPEDKLSKVFEEMGCKLIDIKIQRSGTNIFSELSLLMKYFQTYAHIRPDIILSFSIKPNIYGSIAANILSIPSINNITGLGTAFITKSIVTRLIIYLYRIALSGRNKVFFQNEDDLELFVNKLIISPKKTKVIPGSGINLNKFKSCETIINKHPRFLLIARLLKDKGIYEFVKAAEILKTKNKNLEFNLLGPIDLENKTAIPESQINKWVLEGNINYLGETSDVIKIINENDCIVLPSYREGTPRVLLEAAALKKPLIATNVPGCKDVVDENRNGLLCEVRDAKDLAKKMLEFSEFSERKRIEFGEKSREKVENEYDEKFVIKAYREEINRLIE